jgi:DNA-binding transcriptional ArsR family regulator
VATYQPDLSAVFAALSDGTRQRVIERLSVGPASISELSRPFDIAAPSFLKHMKVLESAGLVRTEKAGRVRTARLAPDALRDVEDWVSRHRRRWERHLDDLGSFLEQGDTQ